MIVVISDFDFRGSGYTTIISSICSQLANRGHDIKILGLNYQMQEHNFPFSIIPVPPQSPLQIAGVMLKNLLTLGNVEAIIVALDIPMQEPFLVDMDRGSVPYLGIFPLESPPLCQTWATLLNLMDARLVISDFGTKAVNEAGVKATYLPIGIDFEAWKPPTPDERRKIRATMGFDEDEFIVLTVAENQERKNLGSAFEMISGLKKDVPKLKWELVSRINFKFGWFVHDLAMELNITDVMMPFERGIEFKKLWALYAVADAFLLTSKAEGLGMPALEAMAMKVPVVMTNHTAMADHMADGRGFPIEPYAWFIDPFGNSRRCYPSVESGINQLKAVRSLSSEEKAIVVDKAYEYVFEHTWPKAAEIVDGELKHLLRRNEDDKTKEARARARSVAVF